LVDDWRGWDWVGNDNTPEDTSGHGTHVTGIAAAAQGNGLGGAGVAPGARVLPLRVLSGSPPAGTPSNIANAFDYAGDIGLRIVNGSLGSPTFSQTISNAIDAHPATLYVIAAGNSANNNDATPFYPCADPAPNVLCVGATTNADAIATFSNYGATTVDLFAPGQDITSTCFATASSYCPMSGTSMAAPRPSPRQRTATRLAATRCPRRGPRRRRRPRCARRGPRAPTA
jgi:subtilisin family serine protease